MLDEKLTLIVNLSKLIAVNEYLRERGDEHVCIVLDGIIDSLKVVLSNLKTEINYGNSRSCNCPS